MEDGFLTMKRFPGEIRFQSSDDGKFMTYLRAGSFRQISGEKILSAVLMRRQLYFVLIVFLLLLAGLIRIFF